MFIDISCAMADPGIACCDETLLVLHAILYPFKLTGNYVIFSHKGRHAVLKAPLIHVHESVQGDGNSSVHIVGVHAPSPFPQGTSRAARHFPVDRLGPSWILSARLKPNLGSDKVDNVVELAGYLIAVARPRVAPPLHLVFDGP